MKLVGPLSLSLAAMVFAAASPARGTVIVATNFGGPPRIAVQGEYQAQSFTTGPTDLTLSKISLIVLVPTGPVSVNLSLYSDAAGTPGTLAVDLGTKVLSTSIAQNDFLYSGSFALAANTTYWAVAYDPTNTNRWYPTNVGQTGGVGTLGGSATSTDGTTWTAGRQALLIQVEGQAITTAVPEPTTLASAAFAGLASLAISLRRRRC